MSGSDAVLFEEIDEEILKRMPEWFKEIRKNYLQRCNRLVKS